MPADGPPEPMPPPPVSPITPTLSPARLPDATPQQPQPPPELIDLDANPDAIALRSAISILQLQRRRATADIQALSRAKDQALVDPEAFVRDLAAGRVAPRSEAARHGGGGGDDDDDNDDDDGADGQDGDADAKQWTSLPQPQNVVRCPPINWAQYAVVGASLDKLHADQVARPTQGTPASVGPHGVYEFNGDGKQEQYLGVAAPYAPGKDRIERKPRGRK